MNNWRELIAEWGLGVPDYRRVERAEEVFVLAQDAEGRVWQANGHHTVKVPDGDCSCQDYRTRQQAQGLACKHLVAVAMAMAAQGLPSPAPVPTLHNNDDGWPGAEIARAVGAAIEALAERVGQYVMVGELVLIIGPTGSGKTSAVHRIAAGLGWGLEEAVGSDSWTEADLVGCWTPARQWAWGPIGRAFERAREGDPVLVFVDEVTRFNTRALDILLRTVQPVPAGLARQMGLDIPHAVNGTGVYVVEAPLLGFRAWAPADNLCWVAAGNPGVNPLDPAFVRRFQVVEAGLDERVLDPLPANERDLVVALWDSYGAGELPLPIEYQALVQAAGPRRLMVDYVARLKALDPVAAKAVSTLAQGHGLDLEGR